MKKQIKNSKDLIIENIKKRAGLTTPSFKAVFDRLGVEMDEVQSDSYYRGKGLEIAKIASAMVSIGVLELSRAKFEKENGKIIQIRNIEQERLDNLYEDKLKELPE